MTYITHTGGCAGDGAVVGAFDGRNDGACDGSFVGLKDGDDDGSVDGTSLGALVG